MKKRRWRDRFVGELGEERKNCYLSATALVTAEDDGGSLLFGFYC